jgi:hypothetical protein
MAVLTLRGVDERLADSLREEAHRRRVSMNSLVLELVRQGLGLSERRALHHDLDSLAGTWSPADVTEFAEATAGFETIDAALWR